MDKHFLGLEGKAAEGEVPLFKGSTAFDNLREGERGGREGGRDMTMEGMSGKRKGGGGG
jgi:hypothetical protein